MSTMNPIADHGSSPLLPMTLYWSSRSPFVRKVLIAAHEVGVGDAIQAASVFVTGVVPVPELEPTNPLGQIPTLVAADGTVIIDSTGIIDFLDWHFGNRRLLPTDYPRRLDVLRRTALAQGVKEKSIKRLGERYRPAERRDQRVLDGHARSIGLCLDALESDVAGWAGAPLDAGHIGLAAALGYLDFRFADDEWRKGRPGLAAWHADFAQRPSYIATAFVDPALAAAASEKKI